MKNLQELFEIIENNDISIYEYEEKGILCGYELNAYTKAGVNEILFLDFRNKHQDPKNPKHFIKEFSDYINHYTIDDRIENNRQSKRYRDNFSLAESLEDFTHFDNMLKGILSEMKGEDNNQNTIINESEVIVNKIELASELADKKLNELQQEALKHGNSYYPNGIVKEDESGTVIYTDEAQDDFNSFYDEYLTLIEKSR